MKKWLVVVILILAAFVRLYRIGEYMTFLGDEGRDVLVVKDILVNHHIPLLGPPTSVGNMYLGPLYYYMMAVSMSVSWLNPVAASVMVALFGVTTVGLIFYLVSKYYGFLAGVFSSLLYALSPITIYYSRSSWNPNPAPLFALLTLIGFLKSKETDNYLWLILSGISLAFAVQMHYLALLLLPTVGVIWLYLFTHVKHKKRFKLGTAFSVLSFLLLMSPVAIFDIRHNLMNYHAVKNFFFGHSPSLNGSVADIFSRVWTIYSYNLVGRSLSLETPLLYPILALLFFAVLVYFLIREKKYSRLWFFNLIVCIWLVVGVLGLSILRQSIYDHYVGFLNPLPFILTGSLAFFADSFFPNRKLAMAPVLLVFGLILISSLMKNPLLSEPNRQLQKTQTVAKFIIETSEDRPFNFALIAQNNYDAAYQFYLDTFGHKPKMLPFEKTDQLYVVCEDTVCNPVGHPKFEVAAFGMAKVVNVYQLWNLKIYKLIPNPTGAPS